MKEFFAVQLAFFKDVAKDYLAPLKVVVAFFGVLFFLPKEMLVCALMDSEEYQKLQDLKFAEEAGIAIVEGEDE